MSDSKACRGRGWSAAVWCRRLVGVAVLPAAAVEYDTPFIVLGQNVVLAVSVAAYAITRNFANGMLLTTTWGLPPSSQYPKSIRSPESSPVV